MEKKEERKEIECLFCNNRIDTDWVWKGNHNSYDIFCSAECCGEYYGSECSRENEE